jgi:hypothetical protein
MAYTTIKKPSDYFNTKLYTGNNSTNIISGVGFQPDWFWIKDRSTTGEKHHLFDAVRGLNKALYSNQTTAETTGFDGGGQNNITAVGNDGFTITGNGSDGEGNLTGRNYASWNWKANGAGSANTDGSISSTVSANTTSGFSIVSYTGTGSNATVGHGLGAEAKFIIFKDRSTTKDWFVYHQSISPATGGKLNLTVNPGADSGYFNNTAPTSSVFSIGNANTTNPSGNNMIAYCFAEKQGFSKFGSYIGNGSTDGTFVYTGFKPSFFLIKNTTTAGNGWHIFDNKRIGFNTSNYQLSPNSSGAEDTTTGYTDILSNGFKMRSANDFNNKNGDTYIYMAFAEEPLVGDNPATAR